MSLSVEKDENTEEKEKRKSVVNICLKQAQKHRRIYLKDEININFFKAFGIKKSNSNS